MTGLIIKKYHVAVLNTDTDAVVEKMVAALKEWYHNRVVIETYKDTYAMFEAVNVNKARNKPFDVALVSPNDIAEKMVLQRSNPSLKVLVCQDAKTFKSEASKLLL